MVQVYFIYYIFVKSNSIYYFTFGFGVSEKYGKAMQVVFLFVSCCSV